MHNLEGLSYKIDHPKQIRYSPFITLCLGSIGIDNVISEPRYKGTILQALL